MQDKEQDTDINSIEVLTKVNCAELESLDPSLQPQNPTVFFTCKVPVTVRLEPERSEA